MVYRLFSFLFLNFLALFIGGIFTNEGVNSSWYLGLKQAPWVPPGWVFGAAWTLVMICFAVYMAYLFGNTTDRKKIILLFTLQWVLNIIWNPIFFYFKLTNVALFVIIALFLVVLFIGARYCSFLNKKSWYILPYIVWLIIATSLNAYIVAYN